MSNQYKLENFEKSKTELELLYNENCQIINGYKEKEKILKKGSLNKELALQALFALPVWFILSLAMILIPILSYSYVLGISIIAGILGKELTFFKNKVRKQIKEVSSAKTMYERLEEEVADEIEVTKLLNKNSAIHKAINQLNQNVDDKKNIFIECESNKNALANLGFLRVQDKIEFLNKKLEAAYQELDINSTKYALRKKLFFSESSLLDYSDIFIDTLIAIIIVLLSTIPLVPIVSIAFSVFVGGSVLGYNFKKILNKKQLFFKFNQRLKEDAMNFRAVHYELDKLKQNIDKSISKVSSLIVEIQETKQKLEDYMNENPEMRDLIKEKAVDFKIDANVFTEESIEQPIIVQGKVYTKKK